MKSRVLAMAALSAVSAMLAGCPVTQPQNTPVPRWMETDPRTGRGFFLYVPSTYSEYRASPVIVTCHGTPPFDVASMHIDEWKMLGEENGCIIIAPTLIGTDGITGDGPIAGMIPDERYILSILSTLGYRYNIDMANIMITGFSGGGFPMYWVGLRHPELFSCVVARNCNFSEHNLDGWYPEQDAKATKIMVYYGENDPAAIKIQSDNAIRYLNERGFRVETMVIPGAGHDRHPEFAMDFFRRNWRPARPSLPTRPQAAAPATARPAAPLK